MKKKLLLLLTLFVCVFSLFTQPIFNESGIRLHHTLSQEEIDWAKSNGIEVTPMNPIPPPAGQLRPIAEFEPAEAVLIRYPFGIPISLIKEMANDVKVITIVANTSEQNTVLNQYNSNGVNTANCQFLIAPTNTYWTRDYGPWFMAIDDNTVGMFDFTYNRPRPNDNQINTTLASYLSSAAGGGVQIDRYVSTLVLTGGNYMNDGISQGFSTTLVLNENTGFTEQQLKVQYEQYLGIEQQHFIADAIYPYDNIQHIDCWGKLLSPNKVLIDSVIPSAPNYNKFEAAANYFRTQISSWGMPYQVYRVLAPGATSSTPKTPYSNSLILNKKVFVPIGGNSYDNAALQAYTDAMPGYEIIPVSVASLSYFDKWLNTDALHCRTHEIADRCMLYVKHQPIFGEIQNQGTVTFNTELYSYCNNPIYSDSVILYIRVGGGEYEGHNMVNTENNIWEVTVNDLQNGLIEYYIFAADESGRRECHPYIGASDPHKFTLSGETQLFPVLNLDKTNSSVFSDSLAIIEDYIIVSNAGEEVLGFEIQNIDFYEMLTVFPLEGTVQVGDSMIITLSYDFSEVENGAYSGSFILYCNDPLAPETEISLFALQDYNPHIPAPILVLDKDTSVVISNGLEIIEDFITISNVGDAELVFEIIDLDFFEIVSVSPLSGSVQAGNFQIITLIYDFSDVENGIYKGSFKLINNDPETPEIEIFLSAFQNYDRILESDVSTVAIYPNPAYDKVNIFYNDEYSAKVTLFNFLCVQLKEQALAKGVNIIDIKELPNGIYFLIITNESGDIVKKLIKQ